MKTLITFDHNGIGLGIVEVDKETPDAHEYELPGEFPANVLAQRYRLVDGVVTLAHPVEELDDDALVALLVAEQKQRDDDAIALRRGINRHTVEGAKAMKLAQIRAYFNGLISKVKADVAPYEIETWDIQRAEYVAWLQNREVPTPYVDGLAAARGITKDVLMAKVGAKIAGLATIQGTQHALETALEACTSVEEVNAITVG